MDQEAGFTLPDDGLLASGVQRVQAVIRSYASYLRSIGYDPDDPYQGLVISEEEIGRSLLKVPRWEVSLPYENHWKKRVGCELKRSDNSPPSCGLIRSFDLSPFEFDVLLLALLPELSPRFGRVIAYLNNDVTKPFPTVYLASHLFSVIDGVEDPRSFFLASSTLVKHKLIRWTKESYELPLIGRTYRLDDSIADYLLSTAMDAPQAHHEARLPDPVEHKLKNIAPKLRSGKIRVIVFEGKSKSALESASRRLADLLGISLSLLEGTDFRRSTRDAFLHNRLPAWRCDGMTDRERLLLLETSSDYATPIVLLCTDRIVPLPGDAVAIHVPMPDLATRKILWQEAISSLPHEGIDAKDLARRYRMGEDEIRAAARAALHLAWLDGRDRIDIQDVESAVRRVSSPSLGTLARRLMPRYTWDDIVLPEDVKDQLRELGAAIRHRETVYEEWGFERRSEGRGINALFAGPSGTGKTMAAEILAKESGMDIFKIDLSSVVSKYVGETEKHLRRIFEEASSGNLILFFDEADALFGKRSEVRDAHDRYANIETAYLLQALEEHTGVVIMATNLFGNLDSAFVRRMHFIVHFPFPDEETRARIWEVVFPKDAPLSTDVDFAKFGKQLQITGGHIRNIAISAAFLAASNGRVITGEHIRHAARRELQKMGKLVGEGGA